MCYVLFSFDSMFKNTTCFVIEYQIIENITSFTDSQKLHASNLVAHFLSSSHIKTYITFEIGIFLFFVFWFF